MALTTAFAIDNVQCSQQQIIWEKGAKAMDVFILYYSTGSDVYVVVKYYQRDGA